MDINIYDVALVPLIIALVQLFKSLGVPQKFGGLISVIVGLAAGFVYLSPADPAQAVLQGLALGLAAAGLYSGTKNTVEAFK